MKSIVFIIPYFGHFNNYFDIWLNSCAHNPTVNWLIFTDCKDEHNYPENVKVVYTTFADIRARFQSFYDFPISLEKPYKLCDFKPAYGEIFYNYIKDYDFWGYCDTDLVWGDIRHFISDEILEKYDKIGNRGHCCLLRNTEKIRTTYRYDSSRIVTYKEAFSSKLAFCFDEEKAFGRYCKESGVSAFDNFTFFDIDFVHDDYRVPPYEKEQFEIDANNIFEYDNGMLFLLSVSVGSNKLLKKEIFYAHFQKRKMTVNIGADEYNHFLLYKDSFSKYIPVTPDTIKKLDPKSRSRRLYMKILWKKVKAEILHCGGVKYYKYR